MSTEPTDTNPVSLYRAENTHPRRCGRCGEHVAPSTARVLRDDAGRVNGCFDCLTATELKNREGHR